MIFLKKRAFSLFEISIIVLIIGVLLLAVSEAIDLVADSKLNSARSLTKGAQILRMSNLVLWVETSTEESWLDSLREDGEYINSSNKPVFWYDLSQQISTDLGFKFGGNFLYREGSYGSLPRIKPLTNINSNKSINYSSIFDDAGFSIFAVVKPSPGKPILKFCPQISGVTSCNDNSQLLLEYDLNKKAKITFTGFDNYSSVVSEIISYAKDGKGDQIEIISAIGNIGNVNIFSNAIPSKNPIATSYSRKDYVGFFNIGSDGDGGVEYYEIIVFGSYLEDKKRYIVEKYLSEKYSVKMPQNPFFN